MSDLEFGISGKDEGLQAALEEAKASIAEASENMKASLEGVAQAFEMVNVAMLAVTSVLAGGKVFSEAIEASVGAAKGAAQLARELGITATQASILRVAMDENFVSQEAVSGAAAKIAGTLKKNENAYRELGVATRDQNGNFRDSYSIMQDVIARLLTFKEGTDRNVEGQKIFGRAWFEISQILRLTGPAMDDAREKAEALGLVVGKEGVAQTTEYRKAMAALHTDFEAIEKSIGDALIPVLTGMGQWLDGLGPQAVTVMRVAVNLLKTSFEQLGATVGAVFSGIGSVLTSIGSVFTATMGADSPSVTGLELFTNVLRVVAVTFQTVATAVKVGVESIVEMIEIMIDGFRRLGNTSTALFNAMAGQGGWSEVAAAWDKGTAEMEAKARSHEAKMLDILLKGKEEADRILMDQASAPATVTPTDEKGGGASTGGDGKEKSRVSEWETALAQKKAIFQEEAAAKGQLVEFSKQQEIDYWETVLAKARSGSAEYKEVVKKIAEDELSIDKARLEGSLATLKNDEDAHGKNLAAKLAAELKYAEAVKGVYGQDSKQYADSQKDIVATKRAMVEQQRQIDDIYIQSARARETAEIAGEETLAKERLALGQITVKQLVSLEQELEARKYAIAQEALAQQLSLINPSEDPVKYAQLMAQIETVALQHNATMLKITSQNTSQEIALQKKLTDAMTTGFDQAFKGILTGTETVGKAFQNIFSSMLNVVVSTLSGILAKVISTQITQLALNKQLQLSDAAKGATAAGASAADTPVIGWALAAPAAAAVFAGLSAYSASGGYDIPANLSPVTQLHPKEMVLPAKYAEPLRESLANGGGAGGGGGMNLNIKAIDSRSIVKALGRNGALGKALKDAHKRARR